MRELNRKVGMVAGRILSPLPSFFDICIGGFLGILLIKEQYLQSIYFIFYIIFLYSLTIGLKYQRNYKSTPLALLTIWSLLLVFVHSYFVCKQSITFKYLNMYLMSEGFIYILFGAVFIKIVITYSRNLRFLYLLLPLAMSVWFIERRATIYMAIIISTVVYLLINKRFKLLACLSPLAILIFINKFPTMVAGWACRPLVYKEMVKKVIEHPIVGSGFDNGLSPQNAIFNTWWGGIYMHNDLLNIGRCLGVTAIIFIIWFMINSMKQVGKNFNLILLLTVALVSLFQMTMFIPAKGAVVILIIALTLTQTFKQEEA